MIYRARTPSKLIHTILIASLLPSVLAMSGKLFFLVLLLLATLSSLSTLVSSIDTLTSSAMLNFNQTLISSQQKYEVGFFTPPGADPDKIYLGIWYYKLGEVMTVVWVANREAPASSNSSVVLRFGTGQIVIWENGNQIWSCNKWLDVVNPVLQLLDTGNLVIMDANKVDDYLWQSFDYPTDTLLPGQKLGWDNKTGLNRHLVSWKSTSDPAMGTYSYTLALTGDPEMFLKGGTETIFRTGPFMGQGLSGVVAMKPTTGINFTLIDTPNNIYYMFTLIDSSIRLRFVMGSDGLTYRYVWVSDHWNPFWVYPGDQCDKYMVCGPYGVCDTNKQFNCECPQGFMFKNLGDGTLGCKRRTGLECGSDGFKVMTNMKMPMSGAAIVEMGKELNECEVMCGKDCDCMAYANARVVEGKGSGCVMWKGDLLDMRSFQDGGQDLYIRLAAADLRTSLECGTDGFRVLRNMKLSESGGAVVDRDMKLEDCKVACKRDCDCTAYSNFEVIDGVGSGCVMWKGDLLDKSSFTDGGQDLYFRLAAADLGTNKSKEVKIGIGISVVVVTFIVAITAAYFAWKAKHKPGATTNQNLFLHKNDEDDLELPFYSFDAIVAITNNFSDENKLGYGGFGSVFKGVLNGVQEVAIKRLSKESVQGLEEFKNEVHLIAKLQHRNLVRLLGYCVDKDEKMLIYEYLCNRSLDYILFNKERCALLDWQRRFNIICGVARGLLYLHHDSRLRIIHRDLKASNVLLDDNMNPKISDFGMARIFRGDETESNNTRRVVGTYGYMSPEYAMNGLFSIKSDVFSFGVLVLEIVTGTQNRAFRYSDQLNLLGYSWKMWEEGNGEEVVEQSLRDSYPLHEVLKCVQIGLLCVQANPAERPTMSSVVLMLSSETATLPQPKLPGFYMGWREGEADLYSSQDKSMSINQVTVTMVDGR